MELQLASRLDRFWASLVDWWIFVSPLVLGTPDLDSGIDESRTTLLLALLIWTAAMGYQLALARRGQSIGKQLRGIRVVRTDGSTPSFARLVLLRNALPFVSLLVPHARGVLALVDAVFILRDDQRCLHDLLADTKVISVTKRR